MSEGATAHKERSVCVVPIDRLHRFNRFNRFDRFDRFDRSHHENPQRYTLNPCMLRTQTRSLFGGHLNKAATCPDFSGKRHLNRRTPWSLCRPVGISTGRDLSRFFGEAASQRAGKAGASTSAARSQPSKPLYVAPAKPEASLEVIRRTPCASTSRAAASQQAGEAGVSTSAKRSQPSNPQPAQAVFPKLPSLSGGKRRSFSQTTLRLNALKKVRNSVTP